jgi:TusA-related sulfurtransferase
MKSQLTFDARGLLCPMPILKAKENIQKLEIGQILEVIADDEGAKEDFPAWCKQTGNEFMGMEEQPDGSTKFFLKRTV